MSGTLFINERIPTGNNFPSHITNVVLLRIAESLSLNSSTVNFETVEAAVASNVLLKHRHALLVSGGVGRLALEGPGQERVSVVRLEALVEDTKPLSILCHLLPVAAHVLEVLGEVRERALEDLAVEGRAHDRLELDVLLERLGRLREHEVRRALDGPHERAHFVRVLRQELLVADVQDRAEAAAA